MRGRDRHKELEIEGIRVEELWETSISIPRLSVAGTFTPIPSTHRFGDENVLSTEDLYNKC